jgi:hypothetical protein
VARAANTVPRTATPIAKPSWRAVVSEPAAMPPLRSGTAPIAEDASVGMTRPTPSADHA